MRGHVVKRERRDDRVTARQRILEPRVPELDPVLVCRAPRRGDLEHVRVDVDELDADVRERVEDRAREASGSGAEVDDEAAGRDVPVEPADDRRDHPLVARDERPDRPVVLVGGNAEMPCDTVLVDHRQETRGSAGGPPDDRRGRRWVRSGGSASKPASGHISSARSTSSPWMCSYREARSAGSWRAKPSFAQTSRSTLRLASRLRTARSAAYLARPSGTDGSRERGRDVVRVLQRHPEAEPLERVVVAGRVADQDDALRERLWRPAVLARERRARPGRGRTAPSGPRRPRSAACTRRGSARPRRARRSGAAGPRERRSTGARVPLPPGGRRTGGRPRARSR